MKKPEAWILTTVFVALVSIPLIAFASGARPEPNQNRPPTPLPELSASEVVDREFGPQMDAYLEDALIIAPGAVAAEAWTDVALGDSPTDEVTLGSNGWLYYTFALTRPCMSEDDVATFADVVGRAEAAVASTGRRFFIGVAPDKPTIVPEFLPDTDTCVHDVADSLEALQGPPSLITVWNDMRRDRAEERPIYFRLDTHWTNQGAAVMAEALIEALEPGSWQPEAIVELSTVDHEGDLTVLLGLPATEPTVELESRPSNTMLNREIRKLLTASGSEYGQVVAVDFTTEGDAAIRGHSLVLHDSYGWALTPMIAPYFESAALIAESDPSAGHLRADLAAADNVVYQIVQRSIHEFVVDVDLAARFVAGYAESYERLAEPRPLDTAEAVDRPQVVNGDVYLIVQLAAADPAEVTFGNRVESLTADSPRTAFLLDGDTQNLASTMPVEYYLVVVPR